MIVPTSSSVIMTLCVRKLICDLPLRSSNSEVFYKKGVVKNFAKFTGKHLCWRLFSLDSKRPTTLLKRDSKIGVSCDICKIFKKSFFFFFRTAPVVASEIFPFREQRFFKVRISPSKTKFYLLQ